jgi:hypothetical protein
VDFAILLYNLIRSNAVVAIAFIVKDVLELKLSGVAKNLCAKPKVLLSKCTAT